MDSQVAKGLMLKLATGMQSNHPYKTDKPIRYQQTGFSLLEILVVLLIIGITLTFALLAFGDFGAKRQAQVSAENFIQYIKLIQHQALLEANPWGIVLESKVYRALRFSEKQQWSSPKQNNIFKARKLPKNIMMSWDTKNKTHQPLNIIIQPTGDMTPFRIQFSSNSNKKGLIIEGFYNGQMSIIQGDAQ